MRLIYHIAIAAYIISVILGAKAFGQSVTEDSKQALNQQVGDIIVTCSHMADSSYCDKLLSVIDKECQVHYHNYCFGKIWESMKQ